MSANSLSIQKVDGILPVEMQQLFISDKFNTTKFVQDAVLREDLRQKSEKVVLQSKKETKEHGFEFVSTAERTEDERTIEEIRNKMICNVFNVEMDKLSEYQYDYDNGYSLENMPSVGELLEDSRRVAKGQKRANARSKKDMIKETGKTAVGVTVLATPILKYLIPGLAKLVEKASAIIKHPLVAGAMAVIGLIWGIKRHKKAMVGDVADGKEKERTYIERLENFMRDAIEYSELVEKDSKLILEKKRTLNEKEFEKWCDTYSKQKLFELKSRANIQENTI